MRQNFNGKIGDTLKNRNTMEKNLIPRHLLPVSEREITNEWAKNNYVYRSLFNNTVSADAPQNEDIEAWKKEARRISCNLKRDGIMHAENEIISLCNSTYASILNGTKIKNMYDVMKIFDRQDFVRDDRNTYLDMLHMFQYGIFRCAYNAWAIDAANAWLHQRNLDYKSAPDGVTRQGKGFVYKLLVSRASNTLCVRFQHQTLRLFNEYVIVRDKKKEDRFQNFDVIPHVFNLSYKGYIMRSKNSMNTIEDDVLSSDDKTTVLNLVRLALKNGQSFETIKWHLKNGFNVTSEGNAYIHHILFYML